MFPRSSSQSPSFRLHPCASNHRGPRPVRGRVRRRQQGPEELGHVVHEAQRGVGAADLARRPGEAAPLPPKPVQTSALQALHTLGFEQGQGERKAWELKWEENASESGREVSEAKHPPWPCKNLQTSSSHTSEDLLQMFFPFSGPAFGRPVEPEVKIT